MNKAKLVAIVGAINAYIQQEEQAEAPPFKFIPEINPWRLYGRQELMRVRTHWQVRRTYK